MLLIQDIQDKLQVAGNPDHAGDIIVVWSIAKLHFQVPAYI